MINPNRSVHILTTPFFLVGKEITGLLSLSRSQRTFKAKQDRGGQNQTRTIKMLMSRRARRDTPHPLQQACRVLADVREAADDVVQVKVAEGGVVFTLPPHLDRNQ